MVESDAAQGIRLKLERARTLLQQLEAEMEAFGHGEPYSVNLKSQPKPEEWIYGVYLAKPIPIMWAVILGEAVHDLRSALDQTIYELTLRHKGVRGNSTGFPLFASPDGFGVKGEPQFRGVGDGVKALVRDLQPYKNTHDAHSMLGGLQKLWTQDKHRVINIWGVQFRNAGVIFNPVPTRIEWKTGILQHGADVLTISFPTDPGKVEMSGPININLAVDDSTGSTKDHLLNDLYACVHRLVSLLLDLDDQNAPIKFL